LYNTTLVLTTFQILQLTNSIKFITDFTVATKLVGDSISGTCIGTCYLQFASSAATVAVTAVSRTYTVTIEGYLTQVVLNPTFVLQQQTGLNMSALISIVDQSVSNMLINYNLKIYIPL
jgi:hypothetical protein